MEFLAGKVYLQVIQLESTGTILNPSGYSGLSNISFLKGTDSWNDSKGQNGDYQFSSVSGYCMWAIFTLGMQKRVQRNDLSDSVLPS